MRFFGDPSLLQKELGLVEESYYEASAERPALCAPLQGARRFDVCVVGGGYSGLSAALELSRRGYSVGVLEAQRIGWGASGRNGGEAIIGFGAEAEEAIERQLGVEAARRLWDISAAGLDLLRKRIDDYSIDCDLVQGYINVAVNRRKARLLEKWTQHAANFYRYPMQWLDTAEIRERIDSTRFHAGVLDMNSGHLHPLKYCLGLARAATENDTTIFEGSPVYLIERGARPVVKTALGQIDCDFVVLAGNVYLAEYGTGVAPELGSRIIPVGTYMIATEPMPGNRADALMPGRPAVSDNNFILDYFRLSADHRLVFGAGESYSGKTPRNLIADMRRRMLAVFPQLRDLEIKHAWGGFVDLTLNKAPHFGRLGSNVYYLQGFSGHGVVMTGMAGALVAEAISGQAERFDIFSRISHVPFPGGRVLRTPLVELGMLYFRLRDALG
jgi:gamma-glutamylputrescine oxidase